MTTNRIKKFVKPATLVETQSDFERVIGELVERKIAQRDLQNAMDAELAAVRCKYEAELPSIETEIADRLKLAQDYCDAHPDIFPRDRKSIEIVHAIVGYRTGTPKLKLLRGWTWDRCLEMIQQFGFPFARTKLEVDKESILRFAAEETDQERLRTRVLKPIGAQIVQDETFYVEPKIEAQPARVTEAA